MPDTQERTEVTEPTIQSYENKPILVLPNARWPFQFGLGKAKLIVEHMAKIQAFVASGGKALEP